MCVWLPTGVRLGTEIIGVFKGFVLIRRDRRGVVHPIPPEFGHSVNRLVKAGREGRSAVVRTWPIMFSGNMYGDRGAERMRAMRSALGLARVSLRVAVDSTNVSAL